MMRGSAYAGTLDRTMLGQGRCICSFTHIIDMLHQKVSPQSTSTPHHLCHTLCCLARLPVALPGIRAGWRAPPWRGATLAGGTGIILLVPCASKPARRAPQQSPAQPPGMHLRAPPPLPPRQSAGPAAPHPVGVSGQGHQPGVPAGARHALQVSRFVIARVGAATLVVSAGVSMGSVQWALGGGMG